MFQGRTISKALALIFIGGIAASCQRDPLSDIEIAPGEVAVSASLENKTSLWPDGNVTWVQGEKVTFVWDKTYSGPGATATGSVIAANILESGERAAFVAPMPYKTTGDDPTVFAVSPADDAMNPEVSQGYLWLNIPTNPDIDAPDGGFSAASIALAKLNFSSSEKAAASFYNLCAVLRITVPANTAKIIVKSPGKDIAGRVKVDMTTPSNPAMAGLINNAKTITATVTGGGTYYIAALPVSCSGGLYICALDSSDNILAEKYSPSSVTLSRAKLETVSLAEGEYAVKRFMSVDGSGDRSGLNWENSWNLDDFRSKINTPLCDDAVVYVKQGIYTVSSAITLNANHNITIVGGLPSTNTGVSQKGASLSNPTTFTGANSSGIFSVSNGCSCTMQTVVLQNAKSSSYRGSALIFKGWSSAENPTQVTLSGCSILNNENTLTNGGGGAIFFENTDQPTAMTLTLDACTISGNKTYTGPGGAIYASAASGKQAKLIVNNCAFSGNSTGTPTSGVAGGGALYADNVSTDISSSTFTGNNGKTFGGCIYLLGGSQLQLQGCTFGASEDASKRNWSNLNSGGAIYATGDGTAVSSASSKYFLNYSGDCGGAIAICNGSLYAGSGDVFTGNNCPHHGGAVLAYYGATINLTGACTFTGNNAGMTGGAIMVTANNFASSPLYLKSSITSDRTVFSANYSASEGGALFVGGNLSGEETISTCSLVSTTFSGNATTGTKKHGGALAISAATLSLNGGLFEGNRVWASETDGGAIGIENGWNVTISGSTFKSNTATYDGGAIKVASCYGITVSECIFGAQNCANTAGNRGGAVRLAATANMPRNGYYLADFYNNTFSYNTAATMGGAMDLGDNGEKVLKFNSYNNTFDHNSANQGGAVSVWRRNGNICSDDSGEVGPIFSGDSFIGNSATNPLDRDKGGSAVCVYSTNYADYPQRIRFTNNCKFKENVTTNGSGTVLVGSHARMKMDGCYFYHNQALYSADIRLIQVSGTNSTTGLGYTDSFAFITNCVFDSSTSTSTHACGISISNADYAQTATLGGGTLALNNCTFTNQQFTATSVGKKGAQSVVYSDYWPSMLISCTFFNNLTADLSADYRPGQFYGGGPNADCPAILCNNLMLGAYTSDSDYMPSINGEKREESARIDAKTWGHNWTYCSTDYVVDQSPADHRNRNHYAFTYSQFVNSSRSAEYRGNRTTMDVKTGYVYFAHNISIRNDATYNWLRDAVQDFDFKWHKFSGQSDSFLEFITSSTANNYLRIDITGTTRTLGTTTSSGGTWPGSYEDHSQTPPAISTMSPNTDNLNSGSTHTW